MTSHRQLLDSPSARPLPEAARSALPHFRSNHSLPFAGLDLHKKEVEAAVLPDHGNQPIRHRFPATNEGILAFAKSHLSQQHQVAVEATTNTWALVRLLQPLVHSVHVSNPIATHAIAKSKVKTDKVDALVLAQLLRSGFLPTVWPPDETTAELRRRCTERANLTLGKGWNGFDRAHPV